MRPLLPKTRIGCIHLVLLRRGFSADKAGTVFDAPGKFKSKIDYTYVPEVLKQIETKWKGRVDQHWKSSINTQNLTDTNKPKYILSMFPYPSGQLHLGHIRIYTASDIFFKTNLLCEQESVHPMGFDSFGLPAENAAKLNQQNPFLWTENNVKQMREQLDNMGYHFHWRENTSDPSFYRWTQWLFIQLYKSGLVYQGISQVNWDPVDCTVLADEQVDSEGCSWRSGAKVVKRFHKQWLVKTNAFANELYAGDDILDTGHWSFILAHQRNWVKKPTGYLFYLKLDHNQGTDVLQVFSKYPELFLSPRAFIGISPSHWLAHGKEPNSLIARIDNPFVDSHKMDIRVIDNVPMPTSTDATILVFRESFENENIRKEVVQMAKTQGIGGYFTSDTYRDWLISRQRFWGTPIPIVHCQQCGPVPESEDNLPIVLPNVDYKNISEFKSQDVASPLRHFAPDNWLNTQCPSCGSDGAIRETDTCDTFFDSSWYFLRYFSSPDSAKPFDGDNLLPVYCYVGGKEHAALHLFYARFMTHFLHSKGYINFREPFRTLLMEAVVKGRTFKLDGKYISAEEAKDNPNVQVTYEKMSKSKGNGINPNDLIAQYGSDAVRWTMISKGGPKSEKLWDTNEKEFGPAMVYFHRILLTIEEFIAAKQETSKLKALDQESYESGLSKLADSIDKSTHRLLYAIEASYQIGNGTINIHTLINALRTNMRNNIVLSSEFERGLASLLVMISPIIPCFAAECWETFTKHVVDHDRLTQIGFHLNKPVFEQKWPKVLNPEFKFIIRFTCRDENGKEKECQRIRVPLRKMGSFSEKEIRQLLRQGLFEEEIEWIDIVKQCSVVVRVKNEFNACQLLKQSSFELAYDNE